MQGTAAGALAGSAQGRASAGHVHLTMVHPFQTRKQGSGSPEPGLGVHPLQRGNGRLEGPRRGRLDEAKPPGVCSAPRQHLHLQHDALQAHAVDLGRRKGRERLVLRGAVHAERLPRARAARAALALVCARLWTERRASVGGKSPVARAMSRRGPELGIPSQASLLQPPHH